MKKIIISTLLTILLVLTAVPKLVFAEDERTITPDYSWYGDSSKTTYEIATVEQLVGLANIVNGKAEGIEKDSFNGKTVKLRRNLDLTGVVWTPIGSSMYDHYPDNPNTKMFEGTFDGTYHTINGLSSKNYQALPEDISSGEHSYGLIGYGYGASVKNLNMTNVSISCSGETGADGSGVAAVIGFYVPKDKAVSVIENVHLLSGKVQATNNMGGVVGYTEIYGDSIDIDITYKNVTNDAEVIADAREAGGILGLFQSANGHKGSLKFINCVNNGSITVNAGSGSVAASGILGKEQSYGYKNYEFKVYFDKCKNTGDITVNGRSGSGTETHASGIGTVYYSYGSPVVVNHCVNTGKITINGNSQANFIDGVFAHPAIGEVNKIDAILQNGSYNTGIITAPVTTAMIVKYDVNEAMGNEESVRTAPGKSFKLATGSNLTREGYIFNGWNTKIDGTGTSYAGGITTSFTEATTLYAQWKKEKEDWYIAAVPSQLYTGNPIKPKVYAYTNSNNLIAEDKYTVSYDANCINAGKHKVKVTYNGETLEQEYEIIEIRPEFNVSPSKTEVEGRKEIEIKIDGTLSEDIELICDDPDVVITKKDNNTYIAKLPNKDTEYMFTAIYKENNNHFEGFQSITIKGTHNPLDDIVPPNTIDSLTKTILLILVSIIGMVTTVIILKKVKE